MSAPDGIWFVYRTHYEGPLSKRVRRLAAPSILAWFQAKIEEARTSLTPADVGVAELGGPVHGLGSLFEAAHKHSLHTPKTTTALRKLLVEHLAIAIPEDNVQLDAHSVRIRTDDRAGRAGVLLLRRRRCPPHPRLGRVPAPRRASPPDRRERRGRLQPPARGGRLRRHRRRRRRGGGRHLRRPAHLRRQRLAPRHHRRVPGRPRRRPRRPPPRRILRRAGPSSCVSSVPCSTTATPPWRRPCIASRPTRSARWPRTRPPPASATASAPPPAPSFSPPQTPFKGGTPRGPSFKRALAPCSSRRTCRPSWVTSSGSSSTTAGAPLTRTSPRASSATAATGIPFAAARAAARTTKAPKAPKSLKEPKAARPRPSAPPAPARPRPRPRPSTSTRGAAVADRTEADARAYAPSDRFQEGELIQHTKFGLGVVVRSDPRPSARSSSPAPRG